MHLRAGGQGVALELFEIMGHMRNGVVFDGGGGGSRGGRNSGQAATAAARFARALPVVRSMATLSCRSARALSTRWSKAALISLPPRSPFRHAREDFGGVEHPGPGAVAMQLARHVHQASKIAAEQQVGAAGDDVFRLVADDGVGNMRNI